LKNQVWRTIAVFVIESDLDLMTGEITNIREYYTSPSSAPVDTEKLVEEALMPDEDMRTEKEKS
jgi:hypothetical protein